MTSRAPSVFSEKALSQIESAINARARIEGACKDFDDIKYENPFSGFNWQSVFSEDATLKDRMKFFLMFPITITLLGVMCLLVPVVYFNYRLDLNRRRRSIRAKLRYLSKQRIDRDDEALTTLEGLWRAYGPDSEGLPESAKIEVLNKWLDVLYGSGMAAQLNVDKRIAAVARGHSEANREYYEGTSDLHIYLGSVVEPVVDELSAQLGRWTQLPKS